ncbi:DNA-binding domain-containing protein [uncultured Dokdonia sp.]|uniref:HvfC/BufC N-terminal domain-containing protein n=1 Tax=uncultured Dokdonia sp. TaxID=575653 RepID=UPI0026336BAF|nr:DNA-binding domain-containing protein [uncultured Dokdonia sp.]
MYIDKGKHSDLTSQLRNVQSWMQQQLLHPSRDVSIDDRIHSTSKLSASEHLAIYQRSYIARLRDCMEKQFPALAYALGGELFQNFTDVFLSEYPSGSYTLTNLGRHFSLFLEETRPDREASRKESWPDFMIELAQFEYQINSAFDERVSKDYQPSVSQNDSDLVLTPVLYLFRNRFPISRYYKAYIQEQEPTLPFEEESFAVLIRKEYKLGLFELNPAQYVFLSYVKEQQSVPKAKRRFLEEYSFSKKEFESFWNVWKRKWIEEGFFE